MFEKYIRQYFDKKLYFDFVRLFVLNNLICFFIALLNIVLQDSARVAKAKDKYNELYHRIAEQHAAIAAQREVERRAYNAISVANDVNNHSILIMFYACLNKLLRIAYA